jgi:hypothetical protein
MSMTFDLTKCNGLVRLAENKRLKVPLTDLCERKTLLAG